MPFFPLLIDPLFIPLQTCRGTAADCVELQPEFITKRAITDGSQDEMRWGDPSQLYKGHDSCDALLPSQFG